MSSDPNFCFDTPSWLDKDGADCKNYEKSGICQNGGYYYAAQYFAGKIYNFPELNCCQCGKKHYRNYMSPVAPSTVEGTCTHSPQNSISHHIREYC